MYVKLYYFFDPLCGWCHGFSNVFEKLRANYRNVDFHLVCGGMILGKSEGYLGEKGKNILHVLPRVSSITGGEFGDAYKSVLETGNLYCSSYKPSLALVIIKKLYPKKVFDTILFLQKTMFQDGISLENEHVYNELSEFLGLDTARIWALMNEEKWHDFLKQDFELTANVGIQGFPTLVAEIQDKLHLVTHGWNSYDYVENVLAELMTMENA